MPHSACIKPLEIAAAESTFNLFIDNKDKKEPIKIQISVLKKIFEQYKSSSDYQNEDKIGIEFFSDQLKPEFLKKMLEVSCQNHANEEDLIKVATSIKIQSLLPDLDDKKTHNNTSRKIFALMNRILPYYPTEIRDCFNLDLLFSSCEKIQGIFFKNLSGLLSKKKGSLVFEQTQISYLCAVLMWVSNTKSINFSLIVSILMLLGECNLGNFLSKEYVLTDEDIFSLLPSPLSITDILWNYYQNLEPNKLDKKTIRSSLLTTIKNSFLPFLKENSLQLSLMREFIFSLDKILDFASTTTTDNRTFILTQYDSYRPIIKAIFLCYNQSINTYQSRLDNASCELEKQQYADKNKASLLVFDTILKMTDKWLACVKQNKSDYRKSEKTALDLTREETLKIKQSLTAKTDHAKLKAAETTQTLAIKLKKAEEEEEEEEEEKEALDLKKQERSLANQPSSLDNYQNSFAALLSKRKNLEEKNDIILKEIGKYFKIDTLVTENSLHTLENYFLKVKNKLAPSVLNELLFLHIVLLDNFLTRITNNIDNYKKNYEDLIEKMQSRYGEKNFSIADRAANKKINQDIEKILGNLAEITNYCECTLKIFEIINGLNAEIKNDEFYKLWNLPISFRKEEHKNIYSDALNILKKFETYRNNKKAAFHQGKIPRLKKINLTKLNEKQVDIALTTLIIAFEEIAEKINKHPPISENFPSVAAKKQSQIRKEQIQGIVISSDKLRIAIPHNPHEAFRRSQSFTDFPIQSIACTKTNALSVPDTSATIAFFTSPKTKNTPFESVQANNSKNIQDSILSSSFMATTAKRRMSF